MLTLLVSSISQATVVDQIVAIINGEIITQSEVFEFKKKFKEKNALLDDALLQFRDPKKLATDSKYIVQHLIDEKLLDSQVKADGLEATIEKVEQEVRNITNRNNISRNDLIQSLKSQGIKFSDYQAFIGKSLERKALIEKNITSNIKITEEDVIAYYTQNSKESATQVYEYKISHILFLPKNKDGKAAYSKAQNILGKLTSNTITFEQAARQFSEDPNFTEGGLLGSFKAGEMNAQLEAGIKNLKAGETSQIVKSSYGYHILKLNKKKLVKDPELDKKKGEIRQKLFAMSFKRYFQNWLDRKRSSAFIKIN